MKDFTLIVARLRKTDWDLYRIIDEFGFIPVSDEAYPQLKEGADAHDRNVMAPHRKIRAFTLGRSKIFVRRCDNDKNYLAIRLDRGGNPNSPTDFADHRPHYHFEKFDVSLLDKYRAGPLPNNQVQKFNAKTGAALATDARHSDAHGPVPRHQLN